MCVASKYLSGGKKKKKEEKGKKQNIEIQIYCLVVGKYLEVL